MTDEKLCPDCGRPVLSPQHPASLACVESAGYLCSGFHGATPCKVATIARLRAENTHLSEEVERLKAERQWIPVGERMPDFGDDVLILHEDSVEIAMLTHNGDRRPHEWVFCQTNEAAYGVVTHWMPLPEPPK